MISTPIEANTSSKLAVNLVSRSRMRNRKCRPASSRSVAEVAGDLGRPWAIRVGGGTEDVDDAALQLNHEQHVVAAEQHTVSTWKKSVAMMPLAWAERNWLQVGPSRRGASGMP
jgi:hypothetical protein